MKENLLPKGYISVCKCCQHENGPLTHIIAVKEHDSENRFFLFTKNDNGIFEKQCQANSPYKLYEKIWS